MKNRIVITGLAPITFRGIGREEYWKFISRLKVFGGTESGLLQHTKVHQINDFSYEDYSISEKIYLDRCSQFILAAIHLAKNDAKIALENENPSRIGVILGSAFGNINTFNIYCNNLLNKGEQFVNPMLFVHSFINAPAGLGAMEFGIRGVNTTVSFGTLSSENALFYSYELLQRNKADLIFTGGFDSLCDEGINFLPLDLDSPNFISEGCGILVLERLDHAIERNAYIYAEIVGGSVQNKFDNEGIFINNLFLKDVLKTEIFKNDDKPIFFTNDGLKMDFFSKGINIENQYIEEAIAICLKNYVGETYGASGALTAITAALMLDKHVTLENKSAGPSKGVFQAAIISQAKNENSFMLLKKYTGIISTIIPSKHFSDGNAEICELSEYYYTMLKIRRVEETLLDLMSKGIIPGTSHCYIGQEAVAVGACAAIEKSDYITSTHRGHGHLIAKGGDIARIIAEIMGKDSGYCHGRGGSQHICVMNIGFLGSNGITGGGIPFATGAALAIKMKKTNQVILCFMGDGATNEGTFHESLNLAAIWKLPIVYICENNLYAMSTPVSEAFSILNIADRAISYGILGIIVDGNNVFEVKKAVREAVIKAKKGEGPTLIEAKTYRLCGHSKSDKRIYRTREEEELWVQKDPIKLVREKLLSFEGITSEKLCLIEESLEKEIEVAVKFALNSNAPLIQQLEYGLYA